jgi:hypothetical protein
LGHLRPGGTATAAQDERGARSLKQRALDASSPSTSTRFSSLQKKHSALILKKSRSPRA